MTGFVYAVGDGRGRVKIGWSSDPFRRLAKISSDCPSAAALYGLVPATKAQEAEAHELLATWRVNREWFRHEGAVVDFVEMLPKPKPRAVPGRRRNEHPLAQWRYKNEHTLETFGALLGVPHVTVYRWESKARIPHLRHLRKIKEITGLGPLVFYPEDMAA